MKIFLLQVVEQSTGFALMDAVSREYPDGMTVWQSDIMDLMKAKASYAQEVNLMIQHQPKIRKLLKDVDWVVDGVKV